MLVPTMEKLQVVVLAPTREISVQIANVMSSISQCAGKIKVEAFIGGLPVEQDKKKISKCQVAVGAPGRMKHLISSGLMDLSAVRLFVLDEADRLMEETFKNDISYIYTKLPQNKQIIAASATFPKELEKFVSEYMKKHIKVSPGEETILIGVRQFVSVIPAHPIVLVQMKNKTKELIKLLSSIPFKQCLVFSNYQSRAESICDELTKEGWPAIFINGSQAQAKRLKAYTSLKEFRCRVLLSTDLTSRGIDAENVNLVVNLDLPYDGATYLHRIGRAGRYGTYGIAITILQDGGELERFRNLLYEVGGEGFKVSVLPKEKLTVDIWKTDDFEKLSSSVGEYKFVKTCESDEVGKNADRAYISNVEGREEEALSVIHENRLSIPLEKPVLDSFESLKKELSNFSLEDTKETITDQKEGGTDVPPKVKSALTYLENNGWKSFYRDYESRKNKNQVEPTCNSVEIEVKKPSSDDNSDYSSETDDEESSDSDSSSSETSISESEDNNNNSVNHRHNIYNWYSLWMKQSSYIRNYVQYCHYWKDMTNFS
ncbi:UNVERIFIED_CONTAM: hypothetical protein PYX00_008237 [Menopon gallinae]